VCDLRPAGWRPKWAAKTGGEVYSRLGGELLARHRSTRLFVCTPPATHASRRLPALRQGVPLYLEKPIARGPTSAATDRPRRLPRLAWCAPSATSGMPSTLSTRRAPGAQRPSGRLRSIGESIGGTASRPWFLEPCPGRRETCSSAAATNIDSGGPSPARSSASRQPPPRSGCHRRPAGAGDIDDGVTFLLHLAGGVLATIIVAWTSDDLPGSYWLQLNRRWGCSPGRARPTFTLTGTSRGEPVAGGSGAQPRTRCPSSGFSGLVRAGKPELVVCRPADAARNARRCHRRRVGPGDGRDCDRGGGPRRQLKAAPALPAMAPVGAGMTLGRFGYHAAGGWLTAVCWT